MSAFAPVGGLPFARPGFPAGFNAGGLVRDADPLTPGIQTQPGVLRPTGPSQFVPGGFPGGVAASGFRQPGFGTGLAPGFVPGAVQGAVGFGGVSAGIVDADPITPGIQAQPGVVTATGPGRVVQQGGFGGVGGFGAVGGGLVDADPLTPGIQAQPGTLTATGPTQIVGGAVSGGVLSSGIRQTSLIPGNVGFGGFSGAGVVDADPLTPGIQAQPGVITATGPSRTVQQGFGGAGGFGGIVDADPFTPGIQAQPGIVTATGPSQVVGGGAFGAGLHAPVIDADPFTPGIQAQPGTLTTTGPTQIVSQNVGAIGGFQQGSYGYGRVGGGLVDADPFTPGIQTQPGVITATGPTQYVGGYQQGCEQYCPSWVWLLLCLLLTGALVAGIWTLWSRRSNNDEDDIEE